jgi:hypothetical protein
VSGERTQGGLSVATLLIAASASAAAAFVVPLFWQPGTILAAAMTPIIVAVVSEALRHPAQRVGTVRPRRATGSFDPLAPPPEEDLAALTSRAAPRQVHRRRLLTPRQWKLGLATGIAAFFVAVGVVTASDLLAGDSVTTGSRTTLFGGSDTAQEPAKKKHKDAAPAATGTPEATATAAPEETATPVPTATATPTPAAPKAAAPTAEPSVTP